MNAFWEIPCFYHLSLLRYLQSLNQVSQIPNNFHTKLELLTLGEKCPNTELFLVCIFLYLDWIRTEYGLYHLFIATRGNYRRQHFDWWRHNSKWCPKIEKITFDTFDTKCLLHLLFINNGSQSYESSTFWNWK